MENQNSKIPDSDNRRAEGGDQERRKSDFLSRYEKLTCKAADAIKSVDQIDCRQTGDHEANSSPGPGHVPAPHLESPITPDVEFNEEEVLKTCQEFLDDYDKSKTGSRPGLPHVPIPGHTQKGIPPTPAPRLSLANRLDFPSSRYKAAASSVPSKLSREDEELLEAAQEKSFWDTKQQSDKSTVFERLDNVNTEAFDSKIIRTRSSSLTIHDKFEAEKIKPILKKSTEDLVEHNRFPSILRTRDDFGLIPKTKHEGKYDHVRIRSPSFDRNEDVRIRSPSPDFEQDVMDIGLEDYNDGRSSSPENHSILRNRFRRTSVDGISFDDEEEPQSILKRKSSFGSGSHSPEGNSENTRSILKKSSRNSSRTCSRSGSIEELDIESTRSVQSILKSRNSSRTCSRSGSQEELDLDFDEDWESRPKSILKKKSGSTDDELDERPKSILKSRRSEESLSPHSDQVDTPSHSILRDGRSSSGTRQSSIFSDNEEVLVVSGRNSPSHRVSGRSSPLNIEEPLAPRPILKNREETGRSILKRREKSSSPVRRVSPELEVVRSRDLSCPEPVLEVTTSVTTRLPRQQPRHQTQPVTSEEVKEAAGLNDQAILLSPSLDLGLNSPSPPVSSLPPPTPCQASPDQTPGPGLRRSWSWRRQNCAGRFQTQPITVDEVEMARSRREGSTTPETAIRPNQFLHSFSTDTGSDCVSSSQRRPSRVSEGSSVSGFSLLSTYAKPSPSAFSPPTPPRRRSSSPRQDSILRADRLPARNLSEDRVSSTLASLTLFPESLSSCSFSPPTPSVSRQSPLPRRRPVITASPHNSARKPLTSPPPSVSSPLPLPPSQSLDSDPVLPGPVSLSSPTLSKRNKRRRSQDSGSFQILSDTPSVEDIPGILKNPSDSAQTVPLNLNDPKTPTKSILKPDFNVRAKPDLGFDVAEAMSSSSSTEDLARSFTDVIIDPLPGHGRRSAPETPIKKLNSRVSVSSSSHIPQSLNISADGDLASKLARLAGEADCIKQKMSDTEARHLASQSRSNVFQKSSSMEYDSNKRSRSASPVLEERSECDITTRLETSYNIPATSSKVSSDLPPAPAPRSQVNRSPTLKRKSSRASDLPAASEFYAIYKQAKRRSSSPGQGGSGGHSSRSSSSSSISLLSSQGSREGVEAGVFQKLNVERRSFRHRSVSPHCQKSVDFWEQRSEETIRGRSQERPRSDEAMPEMAEVKVAGGGLAERLAALKQSGEEGWKKRVKKDADTAELIVNKVKLPEVGGHNTENEDPVRLRAPKNVSRPTSLVDRLSKLNEAQNEWQKKVGEKDSEKFTVAGKMEREKFIRGPSAPTYSTPVKLVKPSADKFVENTGLKRTPKMTKFRGSGALKSVASAESASPLVRNPSINKYAEPVVEKRQELHENQTTEPSSSSDSLDFDDIVVSEPLLNVRRNVNKPKRNKVSKNPVKNLAARTDLVEDTDDLYVPADKQREMEPVQTSSVHSHLAAEALAGLASTEDFTSVKLSQGRKVPNQALLPYREKMLIQVKGRRFCQSRVMPPVAESINSGDCYVLVTPSQVFNWQGKFSNVIERARSAEIAMTILQRKELGCKTAAKVETIEEEKLVSSGRESRRFWKCLTGSDEAVKVKEAGPPGEDEEYEQKIVETTCVYEVNTDKDELVPVEAAWGSPPKYEFLNPSKVLVFDFGSEVYVYNGKNAPFETRKIGARLGQELWSSGWDYSDCFMNPVYGEKRELIMEEARPTWTVLGRINSCMETILFREKFLDWPDKTRVIGTRSGDGDFDDIIDVNVSPQWVWADLQGVDGDEIIAREDVDPDLELEMNHLGRGRGYYDKAEMRQYEITTLEVTAWHVAESDYNKLPDTWSGQFHSEDTYVVRWKYKVALTGRALAMLGGGASKQKAVGRDRCAYFFWQGKDSKVSLQGASALHTVELDSEKGPQLRVKQGREQAAFLSLWQGKMIVMKGRRGDTASRGPRLFVIQGYDSHEKFVIEVGADVANLRSRGVFLLLADRRLFLWFGRFSDLQHQKFGSDIASIWSSNTPAEFGTGKVSSVDNIKEGLETSDFWEYLIGSSTQYQRLTIADIQLTTSVRLYHMTSVLGTFEVNEVKHEARNVASLNNLNLGQSVLYEMEQPALFLVDAEHCVYLWQGWFPVVNSNTESNDDSNIVTTGSGTVRWQAERRAAMQTVLSYRAAKWPGKEPLCRLVWAGHETQEFINLFPEWMNNAEVSRINKEQVLSDDLEAAYNDLSRSEYSLEELQVRPLPPGVDPAKIESYLSDEVFQTKFKMTKSEFQFCPRWKQIEMRKQTGLF